MAFTNTSPLMVPTRAKKVNITNKKKEKKKKKEQEYIFRKYYHLPVYTIFTSQVSKPYYHLKTMAYCAIPKPAFLSKPKKKLN